MGEALQIPDAIDEHRPAAGYLFGSFKVTVASYELLKDGAPVELTSKSFDTLVLLVRNRHRVVVKDELLRAVWPDAVVTDDSLIQCISSLRKALGDDATKPQYIATVARRGYRFIAPVTEWGDPPAAATPAPQAPLANDVVSPRDVTPRRSRFTTAGWIGVAVILVLLGGATSRLLLRGNASGDLATGTPLRFSQGGPPGTKLVSGGMLSPDGRYLAFAAEDIESGRTRLWVRPLDAAQPRALDGTEGASRPFWSPDAESIGFFADGRLKTVRLMGGPTTTLATVGPRPSGAAWSPRGQIIFSTWLSGLSAISESGGTPVRVTTLDGTETAHAWPQFLPDGDHFLYSIIVAAGKARIMVGRLSTQERAPILEADAGAVYSPSGYIVFTRSGILAAQKFNPASFKLAGDPFTLTTGTVTSPSMTNGTILSAARGGLLTFGGATGESELAWFDREGRHTGRLNAPVALHNPILSADETRVYGNTYGPAPLGVWVADLERDATSRLMADGSMPMPSPDGRTVGFSSRIRNATGLFTRPLDGHGGDEEQLVVSADRKAITDWSRDDRYLVYQVTAAQTGQDLWAVPHKGGGAAFPVLRSAANEIQGRLSPDGRWLAYASDESGRWEVYVQSFPDGIQKQTISPTGGAEPQWRGDGRELFYLAEDHALMALEVSGGAALRIGKPHVLFRPLVLGEPTTYRSHYAVSRDGHRFLVDVLQDAALDPITVLLNWTPR